MRRKRPRGGVRHELELKLLELESPDTGKAVHRETADEIQDIAREPDSQRSVDDQDLYTIVITTYIPPRQVGDGPWTPWYADYYHPAV